MNSPRNTRNDAKEWRSPARDPGSAGIAAGETIRLTRRQGCRRSQVVPVLFAFFACFAGTLSTLHAATFNDWRHRQEFTVRASGLVKLSLPVETLDAARAQLEDLRVLDPAGNEVPFFIDRPARTERISGAAKSFRTSLAPNKTLLHVEAGVTQSLEGITLATSATGFIKAVQVEGSADGDSWRTLITGAPVFQQYRGASQLQIPLPGGGWPFLRLTFDDAKSAPVPFTGVTLHLARGEPAPMEPLAVRITERADNADQTRLTLDLGGARVALASLELETPDPLFIRHVTLAVPELVDNTVREHPLAHGAIYRVAVDGHPPASQLAVPLNVQAPSRQVLLLIQNDDSPPLPITTVRAQRRPVYLVFLARQAGAFAMLAGNSTVSAPRYDVAGLGGDLKLVPVSPVSFSPLQPNPNYRASEVLPEVAIAGAELDVSEWRWHKRVSVARAGVQQIELDLDVLSEARRDFADLRLVSEGRQIPYILEQTSLTRSLSPRVTASPDTKRPTVSRWAIRLPARAVPVTRLSGETRTALFTREFRLVEEATSDAGEKSTRELGRAGWTRTPGEKPRPLTMPLNSAPSTDTVFLETDNGDNAPLELENVQLTYPVTRVLFKAGANAAVDLHYGNARVAAPRYDLSLVAPQLLAAERITAGLGTAEAGSGRGGSATWLAGRSGWVFWGALTAVVVGLLVIISRMLPKT